ncbi:hypothetical protein J4444_02470 [Candidatus Woesearchaeota archaeon]|nr:hypothetical protein [Candidatus Woesearchaeota archaeon]
MDDNAAEFLGWYLGDGCLSITKNHYEFALTGDLIEEFTFYKEVVVPKFNRLFDKKVELKEYPSVEVCGVYIFEKDFVKSIQKEFNLRGGKKLEVNLPKLETASQKKCFLRGLFDTDESIYFCKSNVKTKNPTFCNTFNYKPKIKVATISKDLMEYVFNLLLELGFSPRYYAPRRQRINENIMYSIVMDTTPNVGKWITEIGFKSPKHNTKIEVWKKFGYCPPHTTLKQRTNLLNGTVNMASSMKKRE